MRIFDMYNKLNYMLSQDPVDLHLENIYTHEIHKIHSHEANFWAQIVQTSSSTLGDKNTSYF